MRRFRLLLGVVTASGLVACGSMETPFEAAHPKGPREWIITVRNMSDAPASLFVADAFPVMGESVGRVRPPTVAPRTTQDVVFTVPPGVGWGIFVNPRPDRGRVVGPHDVPAEVSGTLPVIIEIDGAGELYITAPLDEPGWFEISAIWSPVTSQVSDADYHPASEPPRSLASSPPTVLDGREGA